MQGLGGGRTFTRHDRRCPPQGIEEDIKLARRGEEEGHLQAVKVGEPALHDDERAARDCHDEQARPFFGQRAEAADAERENRRERSEEHTSELQSLMRISYAVFCLKKKKNN